MRVSISLLWTVGKPSRHQKPSKNLPPSSKSVWNRARARFHLNGDQLAMAQATGFTPTLMDEVATGRRIKRSPHDKLPLHATPGQTKKIKRLIRERHAAQVESNKGRPDVAKLTLTLPAELKARMESQCAGEGLTLADEIQALLEARFPRDAASPEEHVSDPAAEGPSQAA
jgi:hypothetical protein